MLTNKMTNKFIFIIMIALLMMIAFSAIAAPIGFVDIELKTTPPTERDWCLNPMGETEVSIAEKGLTCLELQALPSDEISHYIYTNSSGELIANVPHVANYVDFIFADIILPYGENIVTGVTYDTAGLVSREKTFTLNVAVPNGNPKSQDFTMRVK